MKVSKDGDFTKVSQMAGSFQNWTAGCIGPLVKKTSQEKLSKSTRHLILHAFISQRRALQVTTMCQAKDCCILPREDSGEVKAK